MKDYNFYLWIAYLAALCVLLVNLSHPLIRYYKLLRKKQVQPSSSPRKSC